MKFFVTGGAGFIGSAVIRELLANSPHSVVNFDALTYAGNLQSLAQYSDDDRYTFIHGDICDAPSLHQALAQHQPDVIMHLAAESHVDRSIDGPAAFIHTNVVGTSVLLECARAYWSQCKDTAPEKAAAFRFHHISTDEVYGDLAESGLLFREDTPYSPSSPYSASKAASDHLVRAWQRTYGLPVVITNCSNNYGPYQFPEKLIPLMILNGLAGKPLPVYGNGQQIRDWLYVDDHARALITVALHGVIGETYNIGGHNEHTNLQVVTTICQLLDELAPTAQPHADLITYVTDRPGHDLRYAIDASKIQRDLAWTPQETFSTGLRKTVQWYQSNSAWWQAIHDGSYRGQRLGLKQ